MLISVKEKWESVITSVPNNLTLNITINIVDSLGPNVLGGATLQKVYDLNNNNNILDYGGAINGRTIGSIIPAEGKIELASIYFNTLKNTTYSDGKNGLYNTILHEMGHLLGVLGMSYYCYKPEINGYDSNDFDKYVNNDTYYSFYNPNNISNSEFGGSNAVREYNTIFNSDQSIPFILMPVENDGGAGTEHFHAEEGHEGTVSSDNRYINGPNNSIRYYPGLNKELMTGWIDGNGNDNDYTLPLSKITVGFLEDIGYSVDYEKADTYTPEIPEPPERPPFNIYVGDGSYVAPYYDFYSDKAGTSGLDNLTLDSTKSYKFERITGANNHPFYIRGNDAYSITITGDQTSITGDQSFTLTFNTFSSTDILTYYCTSHASMASSFSVSTV